MSTPKMDAREFTKQDSIGTGILTGGIISILLQSKYLGHEVRKLYPLIQSRAPESQPEIFLSAAVPSFLFNRVHQFCINQALKRYHTYEHIPKAKRAFFVIFSLGIAAGSALSIATIYQSDLKGTAITSSAGFILFYALKSVLSLRGKQKSPANPKSSHLKEHHRPKPLNLDKSHRDTKKKPEKESTSPVKNTQQDLSYPKASFVPIGSSFTPQPPRLDNPPLLVRASSHSSFTRVPKHDNSPLPPSHPRSSASGRSTPQPPLPEIHSAKLSKQTPPLTPQPSPKASIQTPRTPVVETPPLPTSSGKKSSRPPSPLVLIPDTVVEKDPASSVTQPPPKPSPLNISSPQTNPIPTHPIPDGSMNSNQPNPTPIAPTPENVETPQSEPPLVEPKIDDTGIELQPTPKATPSIASTTATVSSPADKANSPSVKNDNQKPASKGGALQKFKNKFRKKKK
jgi:hypothetical protein